MSEEISIDDLERVFDNQQGEYVYRLRRDFAERKCLLELMEINFEIIKDKNTGEKFIHIQSQPEHLNFHRRIFVL